VRLTQQELITAVHTGTAERVRPIAMTATAIVAGLLPIFYGTGTGSDVMQRIAGPMVGGMITTTVLCLLVLPIVYGSSTGWCCSLRSGAAHSSLAIWPLGQPVST
jgi:Cu(I)/Ag(I) efflux system membrane protein CusA/SilA